MCAWAHRLMGEGRALALTQHPTHTYRELREKDRKKGLLRLVSRSLLAGEAVSRHENELVSDRGP